MCTGNDFNFFLRELSSKAPTPGGGGASALVGAVGVALGSMVGNLTTGKKKYAEYEEDIQRCLKECHNLTHDLNHLIEKDAEVFEPLAKAYGLPTETQEQKQHKAEVMEAALNLACSVPIQIMEKCLRAIEIHEELAKIGSSLAISDVGVGVIMSSAALRGASLNVFINTKAMKNRDNADALSDKANKMLAIGVKKAEEVFREVENKLL